MTSQTLTQTASQTVGPFFSFGLTAVDQSVLVNEQTQGERITLTGQVLDGDGLPVTDAMVEIWQPDANGIFHHPNDPNHANADPNFNGFGRSETVDDGTYHFETVKPGAINESAPYINVRIFARGMLIHAITRLYFSDEPQNETDPVLAAVPADRRATLIAQREESRGTTRYRLDIRLQGENETVFFDA